MSKAVVFFAFAATAFVFTFLLFRCLSVSQLDRKYHFHGPHAHIRRMGYQMMAPIFDPVVAKVQRIAEEEKEPVENGSRTQLEEQEKKFFSDDGSLNLRLRLMILFPLLDRNPQDRMLEPKELEVWLTQQAIDRLHYRTQRELELRDKDGDGAVSFSEYLPEFTQEDIERNETGHEEAGWWMQQFKNADVDRSGTLNLYELRDFLHPEESRNENIQRWLLADKIRHMDENHDERLSFGEFEWGIYNAYKNHLEYVSSTEDPIPSANQLFNKLDLDKDELLRVEELKPLLSFLCPGELVYAKYYSAFLIQEADDNGDGKLTIDEMLNHEHIFFSTVVKYHEENHQNSGYHDEL